MRMIWAASFLLLSISLEPAIGQQQATKAVPSKPAPRTADGHRTSTLLERHTRYQAGGEYRQRPPGTETAVNAGGEAAWKHNVTATVDPEAICILGGIPRHNASGLAFEMLQGPHKLPFSTFTATIASSHRCDAQAFRRSGPFVLRRGTRPLGWRRPGDRFHRIQGYAGVGRRERQPAQRRLACGRTLDTA